MTQHMSEDTLIRLAMGLLDDAEEGPARRHLDACAECRAMLGDIEGTLDRIREVSPEPEADLPRLPAAGRDRYRWLRVAAMVVVAFGAGLAASDALDSPRPGVVRQQILPRPPDREPGEFIVCEEVDVSWRLP